MTMYHRSESHVFRHAGLDSKVWGITSNANHVQRPIIGQLSLICTLLSYLLSIGKIAKISFGCPSLFSKEAMCMPEYGSRTPELNGAYFIDTFLKMHINKRLT